MAHAYSEVQAEYDGIQAAHAHAEKKRQESLTWEQRCYEGMQREAVRLEAELKHLQSVAAKIPRTENQIAYHAEKMAKFKELYGL